MLCSSSHMLQHPTVSFVHFHQVLCVVEDAEGSGAGAALAGARTVGDGGGHG